MLPVVEPKFGEDCTEAAVREAVEELTLRRGEEGELRTFMETTTVEDSGWGPPLVDKEGAQCLPSQLQSIEGEEWEKLHSKYVEIVKAVNIRTSRKAKTFWRAREAMANGDEYHDQGSGRPIESRVAVRQAM